MMAASRFHPLRNAAVAAALASATLMAGCDEPHVAPAQEASGPAARPDSLAGAPDATSAPPYLAPLPPPGPGYRPGDRDVIYDLGPVVHARDTMAPIPNPPERAPGRRPARRPAGGVPHHPARHPRPAHPGNGGGAPVRPVAPGGDRTKPTTTKPATPSAPTKVTPAKPVSPVTPTKPKDGVKPAAPTPTADQATRLQALQSALKEAVARTALLNVPDLKPDAPADVTLTLPADFASVVRDQAEKQGLQDAAASVNMTALLAGDGYAVAPDEVQSQPLTVGQPTEFHWTVTAQQGAKGPLHADVGADLLGGGDQALQLGSVTPSGRGAGLHLSPRAWGAGLLVLLAVVVLGWLGRGRASASRRRTRNPTRYDRPLDMAGTPLPPDEREL